jgi:hypothetical protein
MRPVNALSALAIAWLALSSPIASLAQAEEVTELGTKTVRGLEVICLVRPPLSREEMAEMMRRMGMGGTMGMEGMVKPTHYMSVIITEARTGKVVQDLTVSVKAEGAARTQPVTLWTMPGMYGKGVTLPRKGRYTILIKAEGPSLKKPAEVHFDFEYR